MCKVMGASRGVPDYYEMLGLGHDDATQPMIKKVMRTNASFCMLRSTTLTCSGAVGVQTSGAAVPPRQDIEQGRS